MPARMAYIAGKRTERQPELPVADLERLAAAAAKRLGA